MGNIILFLEDNAGIRRDMKEQLEDSLQGKYADYKIEDFGRIDLANKYIKEHINDVCCIITDLNMSDTFIADEYLIDTNGGMFTGLAWVYHYVLQPDKEGYTSKPDMPVILYSGFIDELEKAKNDRKIKKKIINRNNIRFVRKGEEELFDELMDVLIKI